MDIQAQLRLLQAQMNDLLAKAAAAPDTRPPPPPGDTLVGRVMWLWHSGRAEWVIGMCTFEYPEDMFGTDDQARRLNEQHKGYIDALVFPRNELPQLLHSVPPADYVLRASTVAVKPPDAAPPQPPATNPPATFPWPATT